MSLRKGKFLYLVLPKIRLHMFFSRIGYLDFVWWMHNLGTHIWIMLENDHVLIFFFFLNGKHKISKEVST